MGRVGDLVSGFVIHPAVGVKTFKELIEYAKKNPGKLAYGSAGLGTATHLRIEMLKFRPASTSCTCPIAAAPTRSTTCFRTPSR